VAAVDDPLEIDAGDLQVVRGSEEASRGRNVAIEPDAPAGARLRFFVSNERCSVTEPLAGPHDIDTLPV
jgi:hypothetical protein